MGVPRPPSRAELERTPEWIRTRERIEKIMAPPELTLDAGEPT